MTVSPQEAFVDEQRRMSWEPLRIRSEEFPDLTTAKDFEMTEPLHTVPEELVAEVIWDDEKEDTLAHMPDPHTKYKLPEISRELAKASGNVRELAELWTRASREADRASERLVEADESLIQAKRVLKAWMTEMGEFT